ncbi:hypothetical protein EDC02_2192 [Micromonospora sp. Llam0]|uniref:hypothetical protein n=1 Tax=Micromonospora sp. Llam0 TaxID=2485143 RepID=UPI000F493D39|nr:hypothetical protein [Micromonospora sp. Llam0]ROO60331.1 hypothetical protein EDC02_2192 [Micromonospora sp. Llam0]
MTQPSTLQAPTVGDDTQRAQGTEPQPIATFAASAPGQVVTILNGYLIKNAVVLGQRDDAPKVRVLVDGQLRTVSSDITAVPISDPATGQALAQQALAWLLARHRLIEDQVRGQTEQIAEQRRAYDSKLAEVRSYAIDRCRGGDLYRDVLNELLARLGLSPYQPRQKVQFTITGEFEVNPDSDRDTSDTVSDVRDYLRINTDQVDNVDEDTINISIEADADEIDDE